MRKGDRVTESYEAASVDDWDAGEPLGVVAGEPSAGTVVEQALTALDGLDELPPAEHVERFEQVHEALRGHLSGDV